MIGNDLKVAIKKLPEMSDEKKQFTKSKKR